MTKKKIVSAIILVVVAVGLYFGQGYFDKDITITTDGGTVTVTDSTLNVVVDSTLTNFNTDSAKTVVPEPIVE